MYRYVFFVLLLFGIVLASNLVSPGYAKEKSASVRGEANAGKWKALRLRNLPQGAKLSIEVSTSAEVGVLLMDQSAYRQLPETKEALFQGKTSDRITFSIIVPHTGNYYVVIDNRDGKTSSKFTIAIRAAAGTAQQGLTDVDQELAKLSDTLGKTFIFDSLTIRAAKCGTANAFSGAKGVVICAEYAQKLLDTLDNKKKAADALMFILLHEVGHVLLRQWDYPFYNNEEVADEFATVLMVMFGQEDRVRAQAEYFAALPTSTELERKLAKDDRHPLSVQRARNILRWVEDPRLVGKWQPVLVPHMQTSFLERLQDQPPAWASRALVDQELTARGR